MSLESLGNFFESSRAKNTLYKAQFAFLLQKKLAEFLPDTVFNVILRQQSIVIECPNESAAAALKMRKAKIQFLMEELDERLGRLKLIIRSVG